MNKHQFQLAAKAFRAGRLTLQEFTAEVFADQPDEQAASRDSAADPKSSVQQDDVAEVKKK